MLLYLKLIEKIMKNNNIWLILKRDKEKLIEWFEKLEIKIKYISNNIKYVKTKDIITKTSEILIFLKISHFQDACITIRQCNYKWQENIP